jgi:hypothetical protein
VYLRGIDQHPAVNANYASLVAGDWIEDRNGLIVQVLRLKYLLHQDKHCKPNGYFGIIISTCYGTDYIGRIRKDGTVYVYPLDLNRVRKNFWDLGHVKVKLRFTDKMFIIHWLWGASPFEAYRKAYNRVSEAPLVQLSNLLQIPEAKELLVKTLREIIVEKKLNDPEFYITKMMESISGKIENATQLKILEILAHASNNAEVQDMFGADGGGKLPAQDADFFIVSEREKTPELNQ